MALDRDLIVRTALRLLDEVGLETLSLRRLAKELDVQASALYWHVKNKQELLDEMARVIVIDAVRAAPMPAGQTWQEMLTHLARVQYTATRSHRDGGALMLTARNLADYQLEYLDWMLGMLVAAGFTETAAAEAFLVVSNYALGAAVVQQRGGNTGVDATEPEVVAAVRTHPALIRIVEASKDPDAVFETGLRWLIAGMITV
ncbi:TetR/AcrR family transcriptional regulator C-terminal domain-containing protein [Fodinicola acaciae]|uniref:TetR/AcrR family transcriptional regulator C-terminal domain-containing protein n=1 Tax=Fodinicola acaciae TaxID=2681555 RepID=UPI0013D6B3CF|nr:TetR/AcrR family transcriptional regulator C-terminal domain-containing protein [Fodinicola acaciae]